MDGNAVAEEQAFIKKCNKFVQIVSCCPLTPEDAMMVCKCSFTPLVLCPLPATFICADCLHVLQCRVTDAFLSALNCNHHTPRVVVHAAENCGGLDFAILLSNKVLARCCNF